MDTATLSLREVVGRATAEELLGVLIALEGRVVDAGEQAPSPKHVRPPRWTMNILHTPEVDIRFVDWRPPFLLTFSLCMLRYHSRLWQCSLN